MSSTLGEKLRQAREERGFTLGEVAEQTRISGLYLESIENDDYRILPGGIFNKGFVKSFAKFVGIDETEALNDYQALLAKSSSDEEDSLKVYKPEVLTDDRSMSSMVPTVIIAAVILGLMTAGILFLVNYLRRPADAPVVANTSTSNSNTSTDPQPDATPGSPTDAPDMASLKVEFKAVGSAVALTATTDGKMNSNLVAAGTATTFEPKESLKLSYSKSLASMVQLLINGKEIKLPAQPLVGRRNAIEFEINKSNLTQIWSSGSISMEVPSASPVVPPANTEVPANVAPTNSALPTTATPPPTPVKTPVPKPTAAANSATNTAPKASSPTRPASTPATQPKTGANNLQ